MAAVWIIILSIPCFAGNDVTTELQKGIAQTMQDESVSTEGAGSSTTGSYKKVLMAATNPITITKQPQDQALAVGDTVTYSIMATGTELTYQWYFCVSLAPDQWYELTDERTWSMPMEEQYDGLQFYCVIKDGNGNTLKSDTATLTVLSDETGIVIVAQPQDQEVQVGSTADFLIIAKGNDLSYAWYMFFPEAPDDAYLISTDEYWEVEAQKEMDGACFYCVVTNGEGKSRKSNVATLSVLFSALTGDTDGNGIVESNDLVVLAKHLARIETITDKTLILNADTNQDGVVNSSDLTHLAKYIAKIIPTL